jgi:hypothetical protein
VQSRRLVACFLAILCGFYQFWMLSAPRFDETVLAWHAPEVPPRQEAIVREFSLLRDKEINPEEAEEVTVQQAYWTFHKSGWLECRRRFVSGYLAWRNLPNDNLPIWHSDLPFTMEKALGHGWEQCQHQIEQMIAVEGEERVRRRVFSANYYFAAGCALATAIAIAFTYTVLEFALSRTFQFIGLQGTPSSNREPLALSAASGKQFARQCLEFVGLDVATTAHFLTGLLVWTILRLTSPLSETAFGVFLGLMPTQICLASVWATLSTAKATERYVQLLWRLVIAYFLVLLFTGIAGPRYTKTLWFTPFVIAPYAFTTWICASVLRWFGWRHVNRTGVLDNKSAKVQFGLFDAWQWSTRLCILIAVMSFFREEVRGWDDLGYEVLFSMVVRECAPTGLIVTIVWWSAMGENCTRSRRIIIGILLIAWIILCALAVAAGYPIYMDFIRVLVAVAIVLATAITLRGFGWRLVRLTK